MSTSSGGASIGRQQAKLIEAPQAATAQKAVVRPALMVPVRLVMVEVAHPELVAIVTRPKLVVVQPEPMVVVRAKYGRNQPLQAFGSMFCRIKQFKRPGHSSKS